MRFARRNRRNLAAAGAGGGSPLLAEREQIGTVAYLVVAADRGTQLARAYRRDGLTKTQVLRRITQQMPLRHKLEYADAVLDGTWPRSRLRSAVQTLYRTYAQEARQQKSCHDRKSSHTSRQRI